LAHRACKGKRFDSREFARKGPAMPKDEQTIERMLRMSMLLDIYGPLLTEKQRRFMRMHYEEDLSFGEIASEHAVSRQAIHDSVKHAEKTLEDLEEKLQLVDQSGKRESREDVAARVLELKQHIRQHGIIYNTEWIQRELSEIIERLLGRPAREAALADEEAEMANR